MGGAGGKSWVYKALNVMVRGSFALYGGSQRATNRLDGMFIESSIN
jgi:hypothetical protein